MNLIGRLVSLRAPVHAERVKFDLETITAELAAATCKQCGNIGGAMAFAFTEGPHFARVNCQTCGAFIEWVGHPDAPVKRQRRKSRKKLVDLGDRCEICLRHGSELPPPQELQV